MRSAWIPASLVAVTALGLAGCGGDEEPAAPIGAEQTHSEEPSATADTEAHDTDDADDSASPGAAGGTGAAQPSRTPSAGECVDVPAAADGSYRVFEAGTATVTVAEDGDRLRVGRVRPSVDWQHTVATEEPDEVVVEFTRGQEQLDLEVELDDRHARAVICNDTD